MQQSEPLDIDLQAVAIELGRHQLNAIILRSRVTELEDANNQLRGQLTKLMTTPVSNDGESKGNPTGGETVGREV